MTDFLDLNPFYATDAAERHADSEWDEFLRAREERMRVEPDWKPQPRLSITTAPGRSWPMKGPPWSTPIYAITVSAPGLTATTRRTWRSCNAVLRS